MLIKGESFQIATRSLVLIFNTDTAIPDARDSRTWSKEWINDKMGDRKISVAVTPNGYTLQAFHQLLPLTLHLQSRGRGNFWTAQSTILRGTPYGANDHGILP